VAAYLFFLALFVLVLAAIVSASVGYVRLMTRLFARNERFAGFWRVATWFVVSLNAFFLHTTFRFGAEDAVRQYPLLTPECGLILLLLGFMTLANGGILLAQRLRLPSRKQVTAGVVALYLGAWMLTVLHVAAGRTF
jgi:hypothetical protein